MCPGGDRQLRTGHLQRGRGRHGVGQRWFCRLTPSARSPVPILAAADQGGASASDYSVPAEGGVRKVGRHREDASSFEAVDDSVDDDGESVQLSLGTLPAGVTEGTHDSAVVSIVRRRRAPGDRQLRAGHIQRGRGRHRVGQRWFCRLTPSARSPVPILRRLNQNGATAGGLQRGGPGGVQLRRHREDAELRRQPTTRSTTTASRCSCRWAPCPPASPREHTTPRWCPSQMTTMPAGDRQLRAGHIQRGRGGSSVSIKVVLSADPERTVTVPILAGPPGRGDRARLTPWRPRSCSTPATPRRQSSFEATDDSVDDDGESVQLSLGTLPAGVTEGTHDSDGRVHRQTATCPR